ncbi:MAG: tRNA lysidine(34) synthetase TilS, partial [Spirochaetales bacterium]|nr:tRNA lysidine(34) synthetase TilS [Spirochaetales bacterium]
MHSMETKIQRHIDVLFDELNNLPQGPFCIAFSGGSDSLALLYALSKRFDSTLLYPFYVNHRLRSETELAVEIMQNEQQCKALGLELTVIDLGDGTVQEAAGKRGRGIEEAARQLRYEALETECRAHNIGYLFTAHNSDDQLETLLMRLGQGASIRSLGGIRSVGAFRSITLLRPFLNLSHQELQEYVEDHGLQWSEDSTNVQSIYLRNMVRKSVKKPFLEIFPQGRNGASLIARRLQGVGELLEQMVDSLMEEVTFDEKGSISFSKHWFCTVHPLLSEQLMFRLVGLLSGEKGRIALSMIDELMTALRTEEASHSAVVGAVGVYCQSDRCTLVATKPVWSFSMELADPFTPQTIDLGEGYCIQIDSYQAEERWDEVLAIDAHSLDRPVLRTWLSGDEILLESGKMK